MNRRSLFTAGAAASAALGLASAGPSQPQAHRLRIPHPSRHPPTPDINHIESLNPLQLAAQEAHAQAERDEASAYFNLEQIRCLSMAARRAYLEAKRLRRETLWLEFGKLMGWNNG